MGYNAIIFQIPLFIMLAIMMNLVTRQWLLDRRLTSGVLRRCGVPVQPGPDRDGPADGRRDDDRPFEGTLLLLRGPAARRRSRRRTTSPLAARSRG